MGKGTHLPNPCECDRLHIWTDCTLFGKSGDWACYFSVVIDDEVDAGLSHRRDCLHSGQLWQYTGIGNHTVNEGEYSGVIAALRWAFDTGAQVHIITDSQLIEGHLRRGFACKETLRPYRDKVRRLIAETDALVEWKPRQYNKAGWYNDERLKERARDKREREKARRPIKKHRRVRLTEEQKAERKAIALAERDDEDATV